MRPMTLRGLPLVMLASAAALVTACSGAEVPSTKPLASPTVLTSPIPLASNTPFPIPSTSLTEANLKYALLDRFGPISWCDPDFYPVAHADEQVLAKQRLPDVQADTSTYTAIPRAPRNEEGSDVSDGDTLAVYREWKLLNAVHLEPAGDRGAAFDLITITDEGLGQGVHTGGSISAEGTIDIDVQEETFLTSCPLSRPWDLD